MKKTKQGASLIIVILGVISLMAFSAFVVDVGLILNTQTQLQKTVETSALLGAQSTTPIASATNAFSTLIDTNPLIASATANYEENADSRAVKIVAEVDSPTYFMKILGIYSIKVQAQAAAMVAPYYLNASNISNLDSWVNLPIEGWAINDNYQNINGKPDNKALSLGPGGNIFIKLPAPLVDNTGAELYIRELGNLEGYFIFAGIDNNPEKPFSSSVLPGDGIKWANISCSGTSPYESANPKVGAYDAIATYRGGLITQQAKFYGSGSFDLSKCGGVSTAKYIKIIDDNTEDGFMEENKSEPAFIFGEHTSVTAGADLDSIAILNHTRLIKVSDYGKDSDSDGLIDILEKLIGTDPNKEDTDGDGSDDLIEYNGITNPNVSDEVMQIE